MSTIAEKTAALANQVPQDKLDALRAAVRGVRDKRAEIEDLKQRTTNLNLEVITLERETLPALFNSVGVSYIGLDAEGNLPAYDATKGPYYHANIAAEWPIEKREEAFQWLVSEGHQDVIKTVITVELGRGERALAKKVEAALKKLHVPYQRSLGVPWNTLTALVKGYYAAGQPLAKDVLDKIGAYVGEVVAVKPRKVER